MDALGLISAITSFFGSTAFFGGVIFLACLVWVTWSTRSGYVLRKLIWRIIHGKSDILDPVIKVFADEQDSLMHFKHHYSLNRIRTLKQAQGVKTWMTDNDEGPSTLRKLGDAFDYNEIKVKNDQTKPLGGLIVWHAFMAILLALALGYLSDFFRGDGAVVTVIKTDNTYAVSKEAAQPRRWRWTKTGEMAQALTVQMCGEDLASKLTQPSQWPLEDAQVLCDLMTNPQSAAYIRDTVRGQKVLVGFLAAFTAIAIVLSYLSARRLKEYQDLEKRQIWREKKKEQEKKEKEIKELSAQADLASNAAL